MPVEIAHIVRSAWKANGIDGKEQVVRSTPKEGQDECGFLDEGKDHSDGLDIPGQTADASYGLSNCTSSNVCTTSYGTKAGNGQGHSTASTNCNMTLGDITQEDSL